MIDPATLPEGAYLVVSNPQAYRVGLEDRQDVSIVRPDWLSTYNLRDVVDPIVVRAKLHVYEELALAKHRLKPLPVITKASQLPAESAWFWVRCKFDSPCSRWKPSLYVSNSDNSYFDMGSRMWLDQAFDRFHIKGPIPQPGEDS